MDRLIFTALNSIKFAQEDNVIRSNNLANSSVPGFRRDLEPKAVGSSFMEAMNQFETRSFAMREGKNRFSSEPGQFEYTQQPTDLAITGDGYFVVQPKVGDPALSRRGDFRVDAGGQLIDGAGSKILDAGMNPIEIPPYRKLLVNEEGQIFIEPLVGEPGVTENIGQIGSAQAEDADVKKHGDGHIRFLDGTLPPTDGEARFAQGYLESSNVNAVDELVDSLNRQRGYELNIKMISMARDIDEASASLMRMPN
jgi:flagellar basal-body rod protein FlgF